MLRHRDAQRAAQALQVSDRNHSVAAAAAAAAAAAVVGKHLFYLQLLLLERLSFFLSVCPYIRLLSEEVLILLAKFFVAIQTPDRAEQPS